MGRPKKSSGNNGHHHGSNNLLRSRTASPILDVESADDTPPTSLHHHHRQPAAMEDDSSDTTNSWRQHKSSPPKEKSKLTASNSGKSGASSSSSPPPPPATSPPSSQQASTNTSLSTLSSRFFKGKANPFANLMSQLAVGPNTASCDLQDFDAANNAESELSTTANKSTVLGPNSTTEESCSEDDGHFDKRSSLASNQYGGENAQFDSLLMNQHNNKKRKAENPKKNSGGCSSETIVPKKPKNMFMMMDFNNKQRGQSKSSLDEYDFDDSEDNAGGIEVHGKFESTKKGVKVDESHGKNAKESSKITMEVYEDDSTDEENEKQVIFEFMKSPWNFTLEFEAIKGYTINSKNNNQSTYF